VLQQEDTANACPFAQQYRYIPAVCGDAPMRQQMEV
jgi:hypothetical protein